MNAAGGVKVVGDRVKVEIVYAAVPAGDRAGDGEDAKAHRIEVASFEKCAIGTMDHINALTQMASADPQWVFITGYLNDLIREPEYGEASAAACGVVAEANPLVRDAYLGL